MAQIILEISLPGQGRSEVRQFSGPAVRVGRAFDNDLILSDRYVSAHHALIEEREDGWVVVDLESRNGIFFAPDKRAPESFMIRSGDMIMIGRVRIRIYSPQHGVPSAKSLTSHSRFIKELTNKRTQVIAFLGVLVVFTYEEYLHTVEIPSLLKLISWSLWIFTPFWIWAGFWSLITRVVKHRTRFFLHLSMAAVFCIFSVPIYNLVTLIGYLASSQVVSSVLGTALYGWLIVFFLSSHMAIATNVSARNRLIFSLLIVCSVIGIVGLSYSASRNDYNPDPQTYGVLKPPFVKIVPSRSQEDFMQLSDEVLEAARALP